MDHRYRKLPWAELLAIELMVAGAACGRIGFEEVFHIPTPHLELRVAGDMVPATTGALLEFPLLVDLRDDRLRTVALGGLVARVDAGDVVFFAVDPELCAEAPPCALPSEIERYEPAQGRIIAWVGVPQLSSAMDTRLFMTFQNAEVTDTSAQVWNPGFVAVWHLNGDPQPGVRDSTLPASDGVPHASMSAESSVAPCQVGSCLRFDGVDDMVDFGNPAELRLTGAVTIEAWFRGDAITNTHIVGKMAEDGQRGWDLSFDDEPPLDTGYVMYRMSPDGTLVLYATDWQYVEAGAWYYAAGVFAPSQSLRFHLDGVLVYEETMEIPGAGWDTVADVTLAARADFPMNGFPGLLDEVRISQVARSAEWLLASYRNQATPGRYVSIAAPP